MAKPTDATSALTLPIMLPASRSPTTVMVRPARPTASATVVDRVRRSPRNREKTTATSGVSEPRNAALAGVVVFTAYTKQMEARNRPKFATAIARPLRQARIVGNGFAAMQP